MTRPTLPSMYRVVPAIADDAEHLVRDDLQLLVDDAEPLIALGRRRALFSTASLAYLGRKAIRRGATYVAHAIRLHAQDAELPWAGALHRARHTFTSDDALDRSQASVDIRRQLQRTGQAGAPGAHDAAHAVGLWLAATGDQQYVAAAARAARWWRQQRAQEPLMLAWYAVHGTMLLRGLAGDFPARPGRPPASAAEVRQVQRHVVMRVWETGLASKTSLAEDARVTRPTLDAWLR